MCPLKYNLNVLFWGHNKSFKHNELSGTLKSDGHSDQCLKQFACPLDHNKSAYKWTIGFV